MNGRNKTRGVAEEKGRCGLTREGGDRLEKLKEKREKKKGRRRESRATQEFRKGGGH